MKTKIKGIISLMLVISILIPTLNVNAATQIIVGGKGTSGGSAERFYGVSGEVTTPGGTSGAWERFIQLQDREANRGRESIENLVTSVGGQGFVNPDGSVESFLDSCKRSTHIWFYASANGRWYSEIGRVPVIHLIGENIDNPKAMSTWQTFRNDPISSRLGYSDGPTIICSAAWESPEINRITLKAHSATYKYNGSLRTVEGHDNTDISELKEGHRIDAHAIGQGVQVGQYPTDFTKGNVVDNNSGRIVNDEYDINLIKGSLVILGDNPDGGPTLTEDDYWRCNDKTPDSATTYVNNSISGAEGYSPQNNLNQYFEDRDTNAGKHANSVPLPSPGASKSSWDIWKAEYLREADDIETPEINLKDIGVSKSLSEFGGVYNITRTLQKDTYKVVHCQPQERHRICGEFSCWWSPWKDVGERIIWESESASAGQGTSVKEINSWQILSVNCNKEGFERVLSELSGSGVENISIGGADGTGTLRTDEYDGPNAGPLGKHGHETATREFYEDGKSCANALKCTSKKLPSASHDGKNNRELDPSFTEILPDKSHGEAREIDGKKQITHFRDNQDREVRADVWYPKDTGLNDLKVKPDESAKRTFAKVYRGTPEWNITTIAPWSDKTSKIAKTNTTNLVDGPKASEAQKTDHDWNTQHNRFIVKTQWASQDGKPYELGINWEYEAKWYNRIPSIADGYIITASENYEGTFELYCEFENVPRENQQANIPKRYPHHDPVIDKDSKKTVREIWSDGESIKVLFSRSVTDTNK